MRAGRRIAAWEDEPVNSKPESELSPDRLAELLDGNGIPTPRERRLIRDWIDSHEDEPDHDDQL